MAVPEAGTFHENAGRTFGVGGDATDHADASIPLSLHHDLPSIASPQSATSIN
jgi:hypothetical protein